MTVSVAWRPGAGGASDWLEGPSSTESLRVKRFCSAQPVRRKTHVVIGGNPMSFNASSLRMVFVKI